MGEESGSTQTQSRTSRRQWPLLAAVGSGHALLHWYQQGFLVVFPTIKTDMGLSGTQAGLIISMRFLISGLLNIPAGAVLDRFRDYWPAIFGLSVLAVGVGYLLVGLSPVYLVLLLTVGLAGAHPLWHLPGVAILSEKFPERRGFAISIHGMGATVGDTLGPVVLGLLLVFLTWRQAMGFSAVPALLLSGVVFLVMRNLIGSTMGRELPIQGDQQHQPGPVELVRGLLRNRTLMALVGTAGLRAGSQQTLIPFLAIYFKEDLGMSDPVIGIHISLLTLLGVGAAPALGILSDRMGRKPLLVFGFLTIATLILVLAAVGDGWKLTLIVTLLGLFIYSLSPIMLAMAQDAVGEGVRATATGFMYTGNMAFSLIAPLVAGILVDITGDTRVAFYLAAGFLFSAALAILFIPMASRTQGTPTLAQGGAP